MLIIMAGSLHDQRKGEKDMRQLDIVYIVVFAVMITAMFLQNLNIKTLKEINNNLIILNNETVEGVKKNTIDNNVTREVLLREQKLFRGFLIYYKQQHQKI